MRTSGSAAATAQAARDDGVGRGAAQFTKVVIESYDEVGYNYRMTDLQAAVGLVQFSVSTKC